MVEIDEAPYMEEIADRMAHYLFYRKHSRADRPEVFYSPTGEPEEPSWKATECYCTGCHERYTDYTGPQAFKHNTGTTCLRCGTYVIMKQMDRGRKGIRDIDTFAIFEGEGNYLAIRACKAELTFPDPESLEPSIDLYTVTAYELRPGKAVQYIHTWPEGWHPKKGKPSEPSFTLGYYGTRSGYRLINQAAISNTFLRYAFGDLYEEEWPAELILWLSRIAECPQLEYMIHGGLQRLACDYVYQHLTVRLNWRSNDLKKILRLTKQELAYIKEEDGLRYSDYIRFRRDIFRGRSPAETVAYHREFGRCEELLKEATDFSGLTARQIMNYARRKMNNQGGYFFMVAYRDYLRECSALGYDMTSTAITMPKDLFAAHDKTMVLMREKQDLELAAKMAERCKELEELLFQLPELGLMIKLPETVQDIIDEGATLNHCVASYADRHVAGALAIVFLRRITDPGTPYYTMEISNSYEIEQCRGRHNNTAGNPKPPTVRRFEEIYARQLDKIWNKRWRKAKRLQRPPRPEPPKHYYRRKKARTAVPAA